MSIFDDGFDMEDATIIGGIMGFAEESIREENIQPDDVEEEKPEAENISDQKTNLRLLENENPGLVAYLIKTVIEHKKKWAEARLRKKQELRDLEEVRHELSAISKTEQLVEKKDVSY